METLLKSNEYSYDNITLGLTKQEVVELTYFLFNCGYISYENHEAIHELLWRLKIEMDRLYPNWTPDNLKDIAEKIRTSP